MPGWNHAPNPMGAQKREQDVINDLVHRADLLSNRGVEPEAVETIRRAAKLIVEIIDGRGKQQRFDEHCDRPHEEV